MKKLLVLGGKPIGSVEIVQRAKELGYYTIVADYLNSAESPAKLIADESWDVSTTDVDSIVKLCLENHIDGVTTGVHEFNINRMLEICEKLNLPCYCKKNTWIYCDNKVEFKRLCELNNIPVAKKYSIDDKNILPYPVITKPVDGSGSRGFHICNNADELEKGYEDALYYSPRKSVLIEEYIPYDAVVIHYTMVNGKCVYSGMSDKISVKFESTGSYVMGLQTFPSKGEGYYLTYFNQKVCCMFENAGFTDGPIWIEAFFNGIDKFVFNEMGYRFGGSLTYYPVRYFHRISQLDSYIQNAMGISNICKIEEELNDERKYCILPIHVKAGEIKNVIGVDSIMSRNDVYAFVPVHFAGEKIENWGSAQQVFCYLHILYKTIDELRKSMYEVLSELKAVDSDNNNLLFTLFNIEDVSTNE